MNYVMPSRTLRNLKSIGMAATRFYNLVKSEPFVCQRFIVSSFNLKFSSIYQIPIVNLELPSFFNMKCASYIVNRLEDIVIVVVHCRHSDETCFCSRRGEFVVIIEVYSV